MKVLPVNINTKSNTISNPKDNTIIQSTANSLKNNNPSFKRILVKNPVNGWRTILGSDSVKKYVAVKDKLSKVYISKDQYYYLPFAISTIRKMLGSKGNIEVTANIYKDTVASFNKYN